ncbi:Hypothetical protein SCF082_LOCUS21813 [Durusdinium trenchii]
MRQMTGLGNLSILAKLDTGIWRLVSDLFYVPKAVFPIYVAFAKAFQENDVFHEMASPTLLATSAAIANVGSQNFGCRGTCCSLVGRSEILSKGFLCGHKVDYRDPDVLKAVQLLATQEPRPVRSVDALGPRVFEAPCDMTSLQDVTLIIHCPQQQLCYKRRSMLQEYFFYFKRVVFLMRYEMWTLAHTCSGEAYACVAEEILQSESVLVPGILYMNFDVGISPCEMARHLNVTKIGTFQELPKKYMTFQELDQCTLNRSGCMWDAWQVSHSKAQILNVTGRLDTLLDRAPGLGSAGPVEKTKALLQRMAFQRLKEGTWIGFSGLYYLPKQVFPVFQDLAAAFKKENVSNEIASPSLLALSSIISQVDLQSFNCNNDPAHLGERQVVSKGFRCGRGLESDARTMRGPMKGLEDLLAHPSKYSMPKKKPSMAFCRTSSLAEVTLVIHCRQEPQICRLRLPLLLEYSAYFKKTVVLLEKDPRWLPGALHCDRQGDPYWCIAEEIPRSKDSSGILYMQFDVGMSPCEMAQHLDAGAVGTFETLSDKYLTFAKLDECNTKMKLRCLWHHWDMRGNSTRNRLLKTAKALNDIAAQLRLVNTSILQKLETGIWRAVSDFLYLPKQAFPVYAAFAKAFKENNIFHELASPTLLMTSASISHVPLQNFRCRGSCCARVAKDQIVSKGFLCGHKVELQDDCDRTALQLLATQEPRALSTVNANAPPEFAPACDMAALQNVTLIIHCTQQELCYERRLLLQEYFLYFRQVIFLMKKGLPWTLARTCAGEAYQCVAEEIESSSFVNSRGMLFLHFDVAMSPCEMSRRFQVERVGTYEELANTTSAKLDECNSKKLNCRWRYWDAENKTKTQIFNALASLERMRLEGAGGALQSLRNGTIFQVFSGLFYLPKKAFQLFKAAAQIFKEWDLPTEIAVPMLLALAAQGELQNLGCAQKVGERELHAKGFVCGRGIERNVPAMNTLKELLCAPSKYLRPQLLAKGKVPPRSGAKTSTPSLRAKVVWQMVQPEDLARILYRQSAWIAVFLVFVPPLLWICMRFLRLRRCSGRA